MRNTRPRARSGTDPDDSVRLERLVARIVQRASAELERRRLRQLGVLGVMTRWRRPVLATSAGLAAASIALLLLADAARSYPARVAPDADRAIPDAVIAWIGQGSEPDLLELIHVIRESER